MGFPWDPWEFPPSAHLYFKCLCVNFTRCDRPYIRQNIIIYIITYTEMLISLSRLGNQNIVCLQIKYRYLSIAWLHLDKNSKSGQNLGGNWWFWTDEKRTFWTAYLFGSYLPYFCTINPSPHTARYNSNSTHTPTHTSTVYFSNALSSRYAQATNLTADANDQVGSKYSTSSSGGQHDDHRRASEPFLPSTLDQDQRRTRDDSLPGNWAGNTNYNKLWQKCF